MERKKTVSGVFVHQNGNVVTTIESIGEYDCIHRREFDNIEDANKYYDSF